MVLKSDELLQPVFGKSVKIVEIDTALAYDTVAKKYYSEHTKVYFPAEIEPAPAG